MEFTEHAASLSSGDVTYHAAGEGDPVLYLHGGGGFRPTAALTALAEKFRVYAPVAPGFDGTPTHDGIASMPELAGLVGEFADTIIKQRCDLLGHSFGGWLAAWIAVLLPENIGQLVLEAPSGFRQGPPRAVPETLEALHRALIAHPENVPAETKTQEILAQNRETLGHYYREPTKPGAGRVMFGDHDTALAERLPEIDALTLILHGTKDGAVSSDCMQFIKRCIPHAFLIYVYDAAHAIEIDQPENVAALVIDFLTRGEAFLVNSGTEE
ncbi:MAG: alpha/beta hydrolase [Rhodospirillales bacterium]|nr:alpha/beta hydrolase [Rhodospirillales bacterium]